MAKKQNIGDVILCVTYFPDTFPSFIIKKIIYTFFSIPIPTKKFPDSFLKNWIILPPPPHTIFGFRVQKFVNISSSGRIVLLLHVQTFVSI